MFVERILPKACERLATIGAAGPVREAAGLMSKPHTDIVVVCGDDGRMVGVLTKTDIVGQIGRCGGGACMDRVATIMTRNAFSCAPSDLLQDVWSVMKERSLQRGPIVDRRGKPIGIIYARDALQSLPGEVEDEEALLRAYVMNIG
ncbi:CBS domain-containing protein [Falsiroseomonas sp.]|uniref:CBS domain-containing protein n=1 Tax=Falsiroseomonas sp. TaxID=2870721 RepID=UPI003562684B